MSGARPVVIAAAVTAFDDRGGLDLAGCRSLFAALGGHDDLDAVFVAGTTGEFVSLADHERLDVIETALDVLGSDRVIAHVGSASAHQARELAARAGKLGATRLAAVTPYYSATSPAQAHEYFAAVRDGAGDAEVFAYLFPDRTGVHLTPDQVAGIVTATGMDGVKVSIPGVDYVRELVALVPPGVSVLSGNDGLLEAVLDAGGAGVVSGVYQVAAEAFHAQLTALASGDDDSRRAAQRAVDAAVSTFGPHLTLLKLGLVRRGMLLSARCRIPAAPPAAALVADAERLLDSWSRAS
ncbi:dihydrodipicolinate synthase family protein [Jiangella aurantiaca]|uniref:Dihydrodipicolinate synthase family protein n=1 Tax=Jiangella aurantiaca TaxID=2530373 RepID=A0A4R5ACT3_9ACTN|nr:dihydrodipicolinate synthase family protein [Jiangella aurantiaca]TDD69056.1 dihydrodipicolinate synthase family protein [Jiangella aurantiaca]